MSVYKTLSKFEFEQAFRDMDRNYFSVEGYECLYEMLDEIDSEVDVIAICCEWAEYQDSKELLSDYGYLVKGVSFEDEDERIEALVDEMTDRTTVIGLSNGGYLVQQF